MKDFTPEEKEAFIAQSVFCKGLAPQIAHDLASISDLVTFEEGAIVAGSGGGYLDVLLVVSGLLRVSVCSSSGRRLTIMLVKAGECFNVLSPYLKRPRIIEAKAMETTRCVTIKGHDFIPFMENHPAMIANVLRIIGSAFDSSNSRILDFMDKKVENRIMRVLSTLYGKFGSRLHFTSVEISEIAGTTPESTLRAMGRLRDMGMIETRRGEIRVLAPESLNDTEFGDLTI